MGNVFYDPNLKAKWIRVFLIYDKYIFGIYDLCLCMSVGGENWYQIGITLFISYRYHLKV